MLLEPGATISDRLRLVRPIGAGGMGSVWVAENVALGANVAVKVLNDKYAEDAEAIARFRREARALARVASEHVVRIFDFSTLPDGVPYMVMELLEGEDLDRRLQRMGRLSIAETASIVAQASAALSKIHAEGIVHRDVKPENLFLTEWHGGLHVKLFDFGIAKEEDNIHLTSTGTTMGTPLYMSPEQVLGAKNVDHLCDLWSLAVVAYHCLTGRAPFDGETYGALCVAIHKGKLAPPSTFRPDLPPAMDAWFERALKREPKQRFASADEARDAFLAACSTGDDDGVIIDAALQPSMPPRTTFNGSVVTTGKNRNARPARPRGAPRLALAATLVAAAVFGAVAHAHGWLPDRAEATALAAQLTRGAALPGLGAAGEGRVPGEPRDVSRAVGARPLRRDSEALRHVDFGDFGNAPLTFPAVPAVGAAGVSPGAAGEPPRKSVNYYGITLPGEDANDAPAPPGDAIHP